MSEEPPGMDLCELEPLTGFYMRSQQEPSLHPAEESESRGAAQMRVVLRYPADCCAAVLVQASRS